MPAENVKLVVDDKEIDAPLRLSIIEAVWHAGGTQVEEVGCLSGVCGSCRVMVRRNPSSSSFDGPPLAKSDRPRTACTRPS